MNVFFYGYPGQGGATYLRGLLNSPPKGTNYLYSSYTSNHRQFRNTGHANRVIPAQVFSYTGALYKIPFAKSISSALRTNIPLIRHLHLPQSAEISVAHSLCTPLVCNRPWVLAFDGAAVFYYFRNRPDLKNRANFLLDKALKAKNCKKVIPFSDYGRRTMLEQVHLPEEKIEVVPLGTATPDEKAEKREDDKVRILFAGTQFVRKGGNVLLEAFTNLQKSFPETELVIVGCAEQMPPGALRNPAIKAHGVVRHSEMPGFYGHADIFCFPTLVDAYGIVLQEAMSHSLPVVSTNINAVPEIVEHEKTGLLVPPSDPVALTENLSRLLESRALRKKMGKAGRTRFENKFSTDTVNKKLSRIYRGAVE